MTWTAPAPRPRDGARIGGALNGSLLLQQPRHRHEVQRLHAFVQAPGPVALEIGVDHGTVLIDHARRRPDWRWIGLEVRKRKVAKAAPHAPDNALLWAADARTVLATAMPAGRLSRVDVLFPTPVTDPRHLLFTEAFVDDLARAMAPDGVLTVASDVPGLFAYIAGLLSGWQPVAEPWRGPVRSRRERVCVRDGLPVQWGSWAPTSARRSAGSRSAR
jgi:tRNA G46 methylase TrmB